MATRKKIDQEEMFVSSKTFPKQASTIKVGDYMCIRGNPCKVIKTASSGMTGKHGHMKKYFYAVDVFTGKKYEDVITTHMMVEVPFIEKFEYQLIDISYDGYMSLLDEKGNLKDDLELPKDELGERIEKYFMDGKNVLVCVLKAMDRECVCDTRTTGS